MHKNRPRNGVCLTQVAKCHGDAAPRGQCSWEPVRPKARGGGVCSRTAAEWVSEKAPPPPSHRSEVLPSLRLKDLQPHLRPIVLAENLGQGHWGGEGMFLPLFPWKSQDRSPGRSPRNQLASSVWSRASVSWIDGWVGRRAAVGSVRYGTQERGQQLP